MPQELKINRLLWLDILTLWLIMEHIRVTATSPMKRELFNRADRSGLINEFLQSNHVDPLYSRPLRGDLPVQDSINKLRRLGLLDDSYHYSPTPNATPFFEFTVGWEWQKWPLSVPIDRNDHLDFNNAVFMPL